MSSDYEEFVAILQDKENVPPLESERRAFVFLTAQANVISDLVSAEYFAAKTKEDLDKIEAELFLEAPSNLSNNDARKAWIDRNPKRMEQADKRIRMDVKAAYLKRLIYLFSQAFEMYKQKARQ